MLVTESVAKNKLCCMQIGPDYDASPLCAGDACMAWRWSGNEVRMERRKCQVPEATVDPRPVAGIPDSWQFVPYDPEDECWEAMWFESEGEYLAKRTGFCGLAGVPR